MNIIVSGAGIAGLTFALCMQRSGHEVTLIEKYPHLRDSGYMMDFFGPGYDVAEALGLLPEIEKIHYPIERLEFLKPDGKRKFAIDYRTFRKWFDDRHYNFLRGDLERLLYESLKDQRAVIFGHSIDSIDQYENGVRVSLTDGTILDSDVLVGADGIHSNVRRLIFGKEEDYALYVGFHCFSYILENLDPEPTSTDAFYLLTEPGRQASMYPIQGDRIATFFAHRSKKPPVDVSLSSAKLELEQEYGSMNWVVPRLIERAKTSSEIYFDGVWQMIMPNWSTGRTVLVGDAAYCVSLLAGQGSAMAMLGGAMLAAQLDSTNGDFTTAFSRYDERMRPYVETRQKAGRAFAGLFIPENELQLLVRDSIMHYSAWPPMSWLVKKDLAGGRMNAEDAKLISRFGV